MKKLFVIILVLLSFGCTAQKIDQLPIYIVNAHVQRIEGDVTILQPSDPDISFEVATDERLVLDKQYVFWLEIPPGQKERTVKAAIERVAITTIQAQSDQTQNTRELSNRVLIRTPYRN